VTILILLFEAHYNFNLVEKCHTCYYCYCQHHHGCCLFD